MAGVDLKEADLTGADLSESKLVGVDVAGADFSDVKTVGARAAVNWDAAKVQPAELPEPLTPPRWLPFVFVGLCVVCVLFFWRRKQRPE